MICQRFSDERMAECYLNGQLEDSQRDQFEVHILECRDCLNAVEALKDLQFVLESQAHQIRLAPERGASKLWRWTLVAAASLAVLFAAGIIQRRRQSGPSANVATQPVRGYQIPAAPPHADNVPSTPAPALAAPTTQGFISQEPLGSDSADSSIKRARKASHPIATPPPSEASSETSPPLPEVASTPAAPVVDTKKKSESEQPQLTSDQAVELYRLGEVRAAPFTFAGIKSSSPSSPGLGAMAGAGHDSASSTFQLAMASYVEGNYRGAESILQTASQSEPGAPNINFYLGVCRLMLGRPETAIPVLKKVTDEAKSRLVQPAHVYLAKAYLQKVDLNRAQSELETASSLPGPFKGDADALLQRVRVLRARIEMSSSPDHK